MTTLARILSGLLFVLVASTPTLAAPTLPQAPIRLVIADVPAFDAALRGHFREALSGALPEGDPVLAGFRTSRIGAKLEDQWGKFSKDLPWTWKEISRLRPRSLGVAVLDVGALEAVVVVETSLASWPITPPAGTAGTHNGIAYTVVAPGAGDASADFTRRAGLSWCAHQGALYLATSERALRLALDAATSSSPQTPGYLDGFASLLLDMDALLVDRYFRRQFLFANTGATGVLRAALRVEGGGIVEVREGTGGAAAPAPRFDTSRSLAASWSTGTDFLAALRGTLLEPVPDPLPRPVPATEPLPPARAQKSDDRYAVRIDKPKAAAGGAWEEGEFSAWRALLTARPVPGFGYDVGRDGARRLVFAWPASSDKEFFDLVRATVLRRASRIEESVIDGVTELRTGPALPLVAWRRTGEFVWIGPSAQALASVTEPQTTDDVLRWARLELDAVRAEKARWEAAEGPASPENVRPFSDRLFGLLGWMPRTGVISVERKKTTAGWSERVVFEPSTH